MAAGRIDLNAALALLEEWATNVELDTYDSQLCWGCGEVKWAPGVKWGTPTYPNCTPGCLLKRTRDAVKGVGEPS